MIEFTYWDRLVHPRGSRHRGTWAAIVSRLSRPKVIPSRDHLPGVSFATFRGDYRKLENVERVHVLGLDFDRGLPAWDTIVANFQAVACFVHTTWRSTDEALRIRAFLRLSRAVTADEYRRVYAFCAGVVARGGLEVDRQASDPSRLFFLPAISKPDASFRCAEGSGAPVDVDGALEAVPPTPPAPPIPVHLPPDNRSGTHDRIRLAERAHRYVLTCEPAISGQGGHRTTFVLAQRLVRGFGLDENTAYRLMAEWNQRCQPPWTEHALRRKIREAVQRGTLPEGSLRDAQRQR